MRYLPVLSVCLLLACSRGQETKSPVPEDEPPPLPPALETLGIPQSREARWRLWIELEREEIKAVLSALLEDPITDPPAVLDQCQRFRARVQNLVRLSGSKADRPVEGLDDLTRQIGRVERLARLKSGQGD